VAWWTPNDLAISLARFLSIAKDILRQQFDQLGVLSITNQTDVMQGGDYSANAVRHP
jgi:hypothetical protein